MGKEQTLNDLYEPHAHLEPKDQTRRCSKHKLVYQKDLSCPLCRPFTPDDVELVTDDKGKLLYMNTESIT